VTTPSLPVNSTHHQAVARVGHPFLVAATAEDGIIEALVGIDGWYRVGVQWHPERKKDAFIHDISGPLFEAFVTACRGQE